MFNLLRGNACMKHTCTQTYTHTAPVSAGTRKWNLNCCQHNMRKSSSLHFLLAFHPPSICSLTFLTNAFPVSRTRQTNRQTERKTQTHTHTLTQFLTSHKQDNYDKLLCILFLWHTSVPLPHISLTPPQILKTSQRSKVFWSALTKIKIKVSKCTDTYTYHTSGLHCSHCV